MAGKKRPTTAYGHRGGLGDTFNRPETRTRQKSRLLSDVSKEQGHKRPREDPTVDHKQTSLYQSLDSVKVPRKTQAFQSNAPVLKQKAVPTPEKKVYNLDEEEEEVSENLCNGGSDTDSDDFRMEGTIPTGSPRKVPTGQTTLDFIDSGDTDTEAKRSSIGETAVKAYSTVKTFAADLFEGCKGALRTATGSPPRKEPHQQRLLVSRHKPTTRSTRFTSKPANRGSSDRGKPVRPGASLDFSPSSSSTTTPKTRIQVLRPTAARSNRESDDAWCSSAHKKRSKSPDPRSIARSRPRRPAIKTTPNETIVIDGSDSEREMKEFEDDTKGAAFTPQYHCVTRSRALTPPRLTKLDASRIAIGKKVFRSCCGVEYKAFGVDRAVLTLSFVKEGRRTRYNPDEHAQLKIDLDGINADTLYHYHASKDDDEDLCFVAISVEPTMANGLSLYSKSYKPKEGDDSKEYIVVEFKDDSDCDELIAATIGTILQPLTKRVDSSIEASIYRQSLIKDSQTKAREARSSASKKKNDAFLTGRKDDEVLLVYPFDGDVDEIERCSQGLAEIHDDSLAKIPADTAPALEEKASSDEPNSGRANIVTIRVEDLKRVATMDEFLNDSLIDFAMLWLSRARAPDVHFFSTHFFTALEDNGPSAVTKWTERKGIDIFEKKLIFIPVNKTLHWSLCVVVNPGAIAKHTTREDSADESEPMPCILFFDSLRIHKKTHVQRNTLEWLNSEWTRLGKASTPELHDPFNKKTMPIICPKVPSQDNSWDCGVFVIRYAFALYKMRDRCFSYEEARSKPGFRSMITESPEFTFEMSNIYSLRDDLTHLIQKLSEYYLPWKKKHDLKTKAREAAEKRKAAAEAAEEALEMGKEATQDSDDTRVRTRNMTKACATSECDDFKDVEVLVTKQHTEGKMDGADFDALVSKWDTSSTRMKGKRSIAKESDSSEGTSDVDDCRPSSQLDWLKDHGNTACNDVANVTMGLAAASVKDDSESDRLLTQSPQPDLYRDPPTPRPETAGAPPAGGALPLTPRAVKAGADTALIDLSQTTDSPEKEAVCEDKDNPRECGGSFSLTRVGPFKENRPTKASRDGYFDYTPEETPIESAFSSIEVSGTGDTHTLYADI